MDAPNAGTGGRAGTGGATGAGGSPGTGGRTGSGGIAGTGGKPATGGAPGSGGKPGTGGAPGTGGQPGTGGTPGTGGKPGTGGAPGTGGNTSCMALVTSTSAFATATQGVTSVVEDFTRDASGAAVPASYFAITQGDHYFHSDSVVFLSNGVQPTSGPNALTSTIAGALGSIMSTSGGAQARDAIIVAFHTEQRAVGLVVNDDEGSQMFALQVTVSDGTRYTFTATADKSTLVGLVDNCSYEISSVEIVPPIPSHWWRLQSVSFAR